MQIAGSAGIRFRMEMVMSSSSDASAQRRTARRRAVPVLVDLRVNTDRGRGGSIAAKICGVAGGPPADD